MAKLEEAQTRFKQLNENLIDKIQTDYFKLKKISDMFANKRNINDLKYLERVKAVKDLQFESINTNFPKEKFVIIDKKIYVFEIENGTLINTIDNEDKF